LNVALKTGDRKMLQKCCHFDRREKSLSPGIIELPRIIE